MDIINASTQQQFVKCKDSKLIRISNIDAIEKDGVDTYKIYTNKGGGIINKKTYDLLIANCFNIINK